MANVSSITRIEWATPGTILISWSDSTLGRYQDQLWRAGFAHASSVCGLTGATVRRGDAVFRPVARVRDRPVNVSDVILAEGLWRRGCGGGVVAGVGCCWGFVAVWRLTGCCLRHVVFCPAKPA
ncbi:DUF3331 domain-containing protein [Paraburkholderia sp.]|uniref:DUF3331 domain-containing protein n=1 Tax=Paraburkholderia sp. TaxID=1926495 RepID=UPI003D6EEDFB